MNRLTRYHALAFMVLALLVAAALRLPDLRAIPPGVHYDEAAYGLNAGDIGLRGERPIFIPSFTGREPLYLYLAGGMAAALGNSLFALRLTSAFVGPADHRRHLLARPRDAGRPAYRSVGGGAAGDQLLAPAVQPPGLSRHQPAAATGAGRGGALSRATRRPLAVVVAGRAVHRPLRLHLSGRAPLSRPAGLCPAAAASRPRHPARPRCNNWSLSPSSPSWSRCRCWPTSPSTPMPSGCASVRSRRARGR